MPENCPENYQKKLQWAVFYGAMKSGRSFREAGRAYKTADSKNRLLMNASTTSLVVKQHLLQTNNNNWPSTFWALQSCIFSLTPAELRRLPYDFTEANKISRTVFTRHQNWLVPFLKRNPAISLMKPWGTNTDRLNVFSGNAVKRYFKNL